ncbi:SufD family Fe-S cluster assembly protein [Candidatus Nanohalovita haloferacivicina]|uniref:SufD family Fe-S cluster assembly protein n=1 Tax=Candidatus Nanohalovita haloferacivicina TaxID=2978046 RepID=UPI00325F9C41|nr:Fe-S cluster assembly protein SufD [Candidatus Nanohalobia archaeon BNXNv]
MKLEEIKKEAEKKIEELENPESIRTPGRTWTRYPEITPEKGEVQPEIETEGEVEVLQGEEAVEASEEKIFNAVKAEEDKLTATHAANLNSVIYIKVEEKASVKITYRDQADTFAHVVVDARENSELTLTEEFRNEGLLTSINEIYVGENATVNYGAVEASESDLTYSRRKAVVEDYGTVNWLNSQFTGELKRTKIETVLNGDNSETEKLAVWYPTGEQHNDISLHAYHYGENTRCQMDSRAVVDDKARSVYEGLQHVGDRADDTQSFQDESVLMLSDKAEVDASPKLMIEDPNVEASHAASAGNLPEKELHYLNSRGLSEDQARRLIVKGYFEPVMEDITVPKLKESIRAEVQKKLDKKE